MSGFEVLVAPTEQYTQHASTPLMHHAVQRKFPVDFPADWQLGVFSWLNRVTGRRAMRNIDNTQHERTALQPLSTPPSLFFFEETSAAPRKRKRKRKNHKPRHAPPRPLLTPHQEARDPRTQTQTTGTGITRPKGPAPLARYPARAKEKRRKPQPAPSLPPPPALPSF